ncbi:hypothetical protein L9F63_000867 [Diploptera punctata]|uniref:Ionotropic glutamate receptor C-terminal domain-containing protein n=1 Tax=Diploptera punctata TaxID=6984 RepID=A0AAD8ETC8_DIPPU|nr:hypothetical protein L9F63_000867 [Diploptera punctata]
MTGELLEGIKGICNQFFKPERKCPSAIRNTSYGEAQNRIIKFIQSLESWTITVETLTSGYRYYYEKFDAFIFILLAKDFRNEVDRQRNIMQNLSIRNAKVLVIILGYVEIINYIFVVMEEFSLYESLVIRPDQYDSVEILTWNYTSCGNFLGHISFLGTCREINLFPNILKIPQRPNMYRNCNMQMSTFHNPPFTITSTHHRLVDGIEFRLIKIISTHLNFDVVNAHFRALCRRQIIGFAFDYRLKYYVNPITYMQRYYTMRYTWFVPRAESFPHISSLTRVFKPDTWACVLLSMILVTLALKILSMVNSTEYVAFFLNTCSVFLNVSIKQQPRDVRIRTVFFSWILFSVFFTTIFQAFMTSFFTEPGTKHQVDTIQELEESNLKLSFTRRAGGIDCWRIFIANKPDFLAFKESCPMYKYFLQNPNVAILSNEEIFMYYFRMMGKLDMADTFHKFNSEAINIHLTLNMDSTSVYLPQLNDIVKRVVEAGIMEKMVDDVVDPSGIRQRVTSRNNVLNNFVPLSLFHTFSCFFYLTLGLTLSVTVFIAEIFVSKHVTTLRVNPSQSFYPNK